MNLNLARYEGEVKEAMRAAEDFAKTGEYHRAIYELTAAISELMAMVKHLASTE